MKYSMLVGTTLSLWMGSAIAEDTLGIFETSAVMTIGWKSANATEASTEDLFEIEAGASLYLSELLADKTRSPLRTPNELLDTAVAVKKQTVTGDILIVESVINVIHLGDQGIADLAALLMFLTDENKTEDLSYPELNRLIGRGFQIEMISFTTAKKSVVVTQIATAADDIQTTKYTESEKTLIVVTSVLSFALFALSIILIWVAGGWLSLRKQVRVLLHREEELTRMSRDIKQRPTHDTDEEDGAPSSPEDATNFTNSSGILGVNPYYGKSGTGPSALDGLGIKMTPARPSSGDSELFTPMSAATTYSDTGRAPIGITSMRKLLPGAADQNGRDSHGSFGIKRLEY